MTPGISSHLWKKNLKIVNLAENTDLSVSYSTHFGMKCFLSFSVTVVKHIGISVWVEKGTDKGSEFILKGILQVSFNQVRAGARAGRSM